MDKLLEEKSKQLAEVLLKSDKLSHQEIFTVNGDQSDKIIVSVYRVDIKLEKSIKHFHEVIAGPYGDPCPCCLGTGRR